MSVVTTPTPSGTSGINQLTGDVTAGPGVGSQAATLANTAATPGTYGDDLNVAQITVDAKGRITSVTDVLISGGAGGITELTGDVTAGPGTGSEAATIPNDTVTYAKMQNVSAASKLLGRGDSGSGDVQEITLGTNLTMTGTTLDAAGGGSGITQLTGDVTAGPGSGSVAATIPNDTVTYAKMQNSATDRLLGRDTAGSGDLEELTVGGGVEFTGSGGIQRSALTGDITASAGSAATTLANSGVSAATYGDATHVGQFAVDAKGRITSASNVAISGLTGVDAYTGYFRPGVYSAPISLAGNFTVGERFVMNSNQTITGAEFYCPAALAGKNFKIQLWNDSGTSLKNVTVSSASTGSNVGTFASSQAVTAGTAYRISMYETGGTNYISDANLPTSFATINTIISTTKLFAAGDANPASDGGSERYPINPTFA